MRLAGLRLLRQPPGGAAAAQVLQHPRQQLLGRLLRSQQLGVLVVLLAAQQQPRLELQQRRDQHQELGRRLQLQLALALQPIDVGEHDLGQLDLGQVELLAQNERYEQVEGAVEAVEIELELGERRG